MHLRAQHLYHALSNGTTPWLTFFARMASTSFAHSKGHARVLKKILYSTLINSCKLYSHKLCKIDGYIMIYYNDIYI